MAAAASFTTSIQCELTEGGLRDLYSHDTTPIIVNSAGFLEHHRQFVGHKMTCQLKLDK